MPKQHILTIGGRRYVLSRRVWTPPRISGWSVGIHRGFCNELLACGLPSLKAAKEKAREIAKAREITHG